MDRYEDFIDSFKQNIFLFFFINSFPSTSNSTKCIISSCLCIAHAAQTWICDNYETSALKGKRGRANGDVAVSYLLLKGQLSALTAFSI